MRVFGLLGVHTALAVILLFEVVPEAGIEPAWWF